ncbi:unnamed protein product, partial [Larinioides sclopetarius]
NIYSRKNNDTICYLLLAILSLFPLTGELRLIYCETNAVRPLPPSTTCLIAWAWTSRVSIRIQSKFWTF